MNRLKLDFSIEYDTDRAIYVENYLQSPTFAHNPPTHAELDTMTNYILWGKDKTSGLNGRQRKSNVTSKFKVWDNTRECESLEELLEVPTFNEESIGEVDRAKQTKQVKPVFDRNVEAARAGEVLPQLESLWRKIDELDWQIEQYELEHNRRKKEVREELEQWLDKWGSNRDDLRAMYAQWTPYQYLRLKQDLVTLRQEQYTLKDIYAPVICTRIVDNDEKVEPLDVDWDAGVDVLPLGLNYKGNDWSSMRIQRARSELVFRPFDEIRPDRYEEKDLEQVSQVLWAKRDAPVKLDLRNGFVMQNVVEHVEDMREARERQWDGCTGALVDLIEYYIAVADLSDVERRILTLKIKGKKNEEIARDVNARYNKTYNINYISTIYCQRAIPKLVDAVNLHRQLLENIFFEENWKKCTKCGRLLLRDERFFGHKHSSSDGFFTRCKKCTAEARRAKK